MTTSPQEAVRRYARLAGRKPIPILGVLATIAASNPAPAQAGRAEAPVAAVSAAMSPGTRFRECQDCPEMVVVPPGRFMMGSPPTEYGRYDSEGPQHSVTIGYAFAVGAYPVTRAQYRRFVTATGRKAKGGCDYATAEGDWAHEDYYSWRSVGFPQSEQDPVLCISWDDAKAFIAWLNDKVRTQTNDSPKGPYRLLSEAEYEYAARAGSTTPYYWGETASHDRANYGLDLCGPCGPAVAGRDRWLFTSPVGSFPPNRFGLYDMSGDAWSFTEDCWNNTEAGAPTDGSAWLAGDCTQRMVKGGGWEDNPHYLRTAERWGSPVDKPSPQVTFRVARTLD
jgi:formylglycine-generating enzyme required for sulfatase activity